MKENKSLEGNETRIKYKRDEQKQKQSALAPASFANYQDRPNAVDTDCVKTLNVVLSMG